MVKVSVLEYSFPHWRGKLTSEITMRKIPDLKSTMREWYNIKNRKIIFLFFCYFGTFLYYEEKSLPIFLLWGKLFSYFFVISEHFSTMRKNHFLFFCYFGTFLYYVGRSFPFFFANLDAEWICTYWISTLYVWQAYVHVKIILVCPVLVF